MKIERKYHDAAKKQMEEIIQKEQEIDSFPEKINDEQDKNRDQKLQSIFDNYEKRYGHLKKVADQSKIDRFQKISESALLMAEHIRANIFADTEDELIGKIVFESGWCLINDSMGTMVKLIISDLFMEASDVIISAHEDVCRIELLYELYEEVHV